MNIPMQIFISLVAGALAGLIAWRCETRRRDRALRRSLQQSPQSFNDEEDWW